jgi:hypothetical protein
MSDDPKTLSAAARALLRSFGVDISMALTVEQNVQRWDDETSLSYDQATARRRRGIATQSDRELIELIDLQLAKGRKLPAAKLMPANEALIAEDIERMVNIGIAPLIAARIARETAHEDTAAMRAVRTFNADGICALVLIGDRGCGKTYAASWWLVHANHLTPPPMRGRTSSRCLVNCDEIGGLSDQLGDIAIAKALVIDDAGTEDERYHAEKVATLIARRYRNALPTIITTNLNEADFGRRYGARINDRMHEVGKFTVTGTSEKDSLRRRGV